MRNNTVDQFCTLMRADHSVKGSVLLTQLFREAARASNEEYYKKNRNKMLKDLYNTFTAFVPDNYEQVQYVAARTACQKAF